MALTEFLPIPTTLAAVGFILWYANADRNARPRWAWLVPFGLFLTFTLWTVIALVREGLWPLWLNQSQNMWGNQVFFDLLLAVSIAFVALAPMARRRGMPLLPWAIFVCSTASIGLTAMMARIMYLEAKAKGAGTA